MRKLILGALLLALAPLLVRVPASAEYVPPVSCITKTSHAYGQVQVPKDPGYAFWEKRTMYTHATVWYTSCRNKLGPDYVRPQKLRIDLNVAGTRMACGTPDVYGSISQQGGWIRTKATTYFFDTVGRNFRTPTLLIPCATDTASSMTWTIPLKTSCTLYPYDGHQPKFRVYLQHQWAGRVDPENFMMGRMPF